MGELTRFRIVLNFIKVFDEDVVLLYFLQTRDPLVAIIIPLVGNCFVFNLQLCNRIFELGAPFSLVFKLLDPFLIVDLVDCDLIVERASNYF